MPRHERRSGIVDTDVLLTVSREAMNGSLKAFERGDEKLFMKLYRRAVRLRREYNERIRPVRSRFWSVYE